MSLDITNAKVKIINVNGKEYLQLEGDNSFTEEKSRIFIGKISLEDVKISVYTDENANRTGDITFKISPQEDGNMVSYSFYK